MIYFNQCTQLVKILVLLTSLLYDLFSLGLVPYLKHFIVISCFEITSLSSLAAAMINALLSFVLSNFSKPKSLPTINKSLFVNL